MTDYVELYIDQGADFTSTININDDDTNLPQNLSGYVVTGALRRSLLSTNTSANLVCSVSDSANGEITFSIDSANTSNLRPGTYLFDIRTSVLGTKSRLLEGIIIVTPAITK